MSQKFRVVFTGDFLKADGSLGFGDIALGLLDKEPDIEYEFLKSGDTPELKPEEIRGVDALVALAPRITTTTLEGADRLALVARFGVGYDTVNVDACTKAGIAVTLTPDGVRRPVASSIVAFILALAHKLLIKDKLTRAGRWYDRADNMGMGVIGRTLGLVGMGNIGADMLGLIKPWGMRHLVYDPYVKPEQAAALGAEIVGLEELLRQSDFIAISCPLTPETRHLINAERIAMMKPTAYVINTARGPIVDQAALTKALQEKRIQGAALDVFEKEPVDADDPILKLDNVIVAPHAICWTDDAFLGNGKSAINSILAIKAGRVPERLLNKAVVDNALFQRKLQSYAGQEVAR